MHPEPFPLLVREPNHSTFIGSTAVGNFEIGSRHLEDALALADELQDGHTGYLIERALDEARSRLFRLIG
jgi:hypothetical protein